MKKSKSGILRPHRRKNKQNMLSGISLASPLVSPNVGSSTLNISAPSTSSVSQPLSSAGSGNWSVPHTNPITNLVLDRDDRASYMAIGRYLDPTTGKSSYITRVYESENRRHTAQLFYEEFGRENVDKVFIIREYGG